MSVSDINQLTNINCIRPLAEDINENELLALDFQLTLQKELYEFFGTQDFDVIKEFFMYIPKGSIFFHGDNINQPEILYTKLKISEKKTIPTRDGLDEYYLYKINTKNIRLDRPVIKINTTNEETGLEIENIIPQTTALLSKASNLRLISNIKYAYSEKITDIADITWGPDNKKQYTLKAIYTHSQNPQVIQDKQDILNLYVRIENELDFIYNTTEEALLRKQDIYNYTVFDQNWAGEQRNNHIYKYTKRPPSQNPQYLTKKILNDKERNLENDIKEFNRRTRNVYKDELNNFYLNCKEYFLLLSKPEDEFLRPPGKTQFFGNPCAETNITLFKGSQKPFEVKTNAKYLYSMQVYMFQNDIFLLDYWKLSQIFTTHLAHFSQTLGKRRLSPEGLPYTGLDKRSMFWGEYFKGLLDNSIDKKRGLFTYAFRIRSDIELNENYSYSKNTYDELKENYQNFSSFDYTYKLRNYQPNEDSPVITHLNFILNLRGFSMNIQGYTDFDPAEKYNIPNYKHSRVSSFFRDADVIGIYPSANPREKPSMVCREYTIFNSPNNLLFLCYSSTLPNYMIPPVSPQQKALYDSYFDPGVRMTEEKKEELIDINNRLSDNDELMFIDFTNDSLFNSNLNYNRFSIDIFNNKMKFINAKKDMKLKIIQKKYTNVNSNLSHYPTRRGTPQFEDLQNMLDELRVRKNIYDTILTKLSNIKYKIGDNDYYLSIINNNLLTQNPLFATFTNHFKGFKLIFVKSNIDLKIIQSLSDQELLRIHSSDLIDLSDTNISNLINNISSGKILNYDTNKYAAFYGSDDCLIDNQIQRRIILPHDTEDYGHKHFNGALFQLIRYNYNCPNKWEELGDKMNPLEKSVCEDIAKKISISDEKLIQDITGLPPQLCDQQNCLERINKLVELYNNNLIPTLNDDDDDDDEL